MSERTKKQNKTKQNKTKQNKTKQKKIKIINETRKEIKMEDIREGDTDSEEAAGAQVGELAYGRTCDLNLVYVNKTNRIIFIRRKKKEEKKKRKRQEQKKKKIKKVDIVVELAQTCYGYIFSAPQDLMEDEVQLLWHREPLLEHRAEPCKTIECFSHSHLGNALSVFPTLPINNKLVQRVLSPAMHSVTLS